MAGHITSEPPHKRIWLRRLDSGFSLAPELLGGGRRFPMSDIDEVTKEPVEEIAASTDSAETAIGEKPETASDTEVVAEPTPAEDQ